MIKSKFFDRENYLELLIKRICDLKEGYRQNIALIGDELIGKTSLILHLLSVFYDPKILPVYLLVRAESLEYFAKKFVGALLYSFLSNSGIVLKEDLGFLIKKSQKFIPQTVEKINALLSMLGRKKKENLFTELISLSQTINEETNKNCILIFDEFQNLERLGIKNLYKEWSKTLMTQKHTVFLVASSSKFRAKKILSENLSLLFGNFEVIDVLPFDPKTCTNFLGDRLGRIDMEKKLKNFLISFTGGSPFYLEVISAAICKIKSQDIEDDRISKTTLIDALQDLLFEDTGVLNQRYHNYLKNLFDASVSQDEIRLLYSITGGHNRIKDMTRQLHKQKKEVLKILNQLIELDVITKNGDFFIVNDRLFAFWLKFVHQKKATALNFDSAIRKSSFRDEIEAIYKEFYTNSQRPFSERITDLLHLFENEGVYIEKRRLRLTTFREIKSLKFGCQNIKEGLIGRSIDTLWLIAIKESIATEDDIAEFARECKKYRQKKQRKIFITPQPVDTNVRLKALEEKVWTWNLKDINFLCDIYNRPEIII